METEHYAVNVIEVPVSKIIVRNGWNIRSDNLNEVGVVNTLKCSIEEIGLMHPIQINKNYELVSGFRRFRAIKLMRWENVPCNLVEYESELHEKLANIDENLERRNLSGKDLDKALKKRKDIYTAIYPQMAQPGRKSEGEKKEKTFAEETAEKTGLGESTIDKKIARVEKATPEVREAYEADKINASQVDELVKLDEKDQNKALKKIQGTSIAETKLIIDDIKESNKSKQNSRLMNTDDKLLAAIFDVERVIKSIKQADVLLEAFFHSNKFKNLDDDYRHRLRTNVNLILHTIDRRFKIDTFFEPETKE